MVTVFPGFIMFWGSIARLIGIVNLSDLGEKEPYTLDHAAFNSLVISSQMLRASERDCR